MNTLRVEKNRWVIPERLEGTQHHCDFRPFLIVIRRDAKKLGKTFQHFRRQSTKKVLKPRLIGHLVIYNAEDFEPVRQVDKLECAAMSLVVAPLQTFGAAFVGQIGGEKVEEGVVQTLVVDELSRQQFRVLNVI